MIVTPVATRTSSGTLSDARGFSFSPNQRPRRRTGILSRLIGDGERFEVGDPRLAPVARANPLQPWPVVERLGRRQTLPDIRTTSDAAIHVMDELFADEARHAQKIRCDFQEVLTARLPVDVRGEVVQDECGNHGVTLRWLSRYCRLAVPAIGAWRRGGRSGPVPGSVPRLRGQVPAP